jgi:hypothetical protein
MFELFLIFCIALILSVICQRTGIAPSVAVLAVGMLAGGLLGFAYGGAAVPGIAAGLLAAAPIYLFQDFS